MIDTELFTLVDQRAMKESGSKSTTTSLDDCRMNYALTEEMSGRGVDLLVLEGMGRAIHTNLYTK